MMSSALCFASLRVQARSTTVAELLDAGRLDEAIAQGRRLLEGERRSRDVDAEVDIGQAVFRALLMLDRTEEAEEMMGQLLRVYDALDRRQIRLHTALDRAVFLLHMNRPERAIPVVSDLVDEDDESGGSIRIELLVVLAQSYRATGRYDCALRALKVAHTAAVTLGSHPVEVAVESARLEVEVAMCAYRSELLSDHEHHATSKSSMVPARDSRELIEAVASLAAQLPPDTVASHRAAQMRVQLGCAERSIKEPDLLHAELDWLRRHGLVVADTAFRIATSIACLAAGNADGAESLLRDSLHDEQRWAQHRFGAELAYCGAKLHTHGGRHAGALRCYQRYASAALESLRGHTSALSHVPRCVAASVVDAAPDSMEPRLPARYRRGYRYMLEHLGHSELSVRQVAAHIGVTERALQMAFHKHLGMTPAEVIRQRRMIEIRNEMTHVASNESVLDVASRWGVTNRSTLANSYRQLYAETPSDTRRAAGLRF